MTLLVDKPGQPGAHALVIGVGDYPHLQGGSGALSPDHGGMGQLSSPPESARAFARFLLQGYQHPALPLASLDLLVSEAASTPFPTPADGLPGRAAFDAVKAAVLAWFARADTDADNLLLFYFCGHGLASGGQTTLLCDDFGSLPPNPLEHALDFTGLYLGLDKCKARRQVFFVDACRVASPTLFTTLNFVGHPVIPGSARFASRTRQAPVYYATVAGAAAYGQVGRPSVFTEATLQAFEGAGCDDLDGGWAVQTDALNRGIFHLMRRAVSRAATVGQLSTVDNLTRFALHHLPGRPRVPVEVACHPDAKNAHAALECVGNGQHLRRPPAPSAWDLDLEEGDYTFSADLRPAEAAQGSTSTHVSPPFRPVRIPVP